MSTYGKETHSVEETFERKSDVEQSSTSGSKSWDCSGESGLWVAVVVLIIIWTMAAWGSWSWFSGCGKTKGGDNKECGFGAGALGLGLLWLIVVILFLFAAKYCGWGAVVGFLVFFLIVLLVGLWWSSC